uniref:Uncharacterized protein n=1 Tax=Oryza rufipogon TaxID=4529 RepID=A0A0E0MY39_ORYRU
MEGSGQIGRMRPPELRMSWMRGRVTSMEREGVTMTPMRARQRQRRGGVAADERHKGAAARVASAVEGRGGESHVGRKREWRRARRSGAGDERCRDDDGDDDDENPTMTTTMQAASAASTGGGGDKLGDPTRETSAVATTMRTRLRR